jgi:hypothetical protein
MPVCTNWLEGWFGPQSPWWFSGMNKDLWPCRELNTGQYIKVPRCLERRFKKTWKRAVEFEPSTSCSSTAMFTIVIRGRWQWHHNTGTSQCFLNFRLFLAYLPSQTLVPDTNASTQCEKQSECCPNVAKEVSGHSAFRNTSYYCVILSVFQFLPLLTSPSVLISPLSRTIKASTW